jgi:hypothetical protein
MRATLVEEPKHRDRKWNMQQAPSLDEQAAAEAI